MSSPQIPHVLSKASIHEMGVDVLPNEPIIFTVERNERRYSKTIGTQKNISRSNNSSTKSSKQSEENLGSKKISIDISNNEFEEKLLDNKCCFGLFNILALLQIITLINFIFDGICAYLSLHTITTYLFAFSATGSLLCLCAVISSIQEEKHKMLGTTIIWVSLKLLVIGILYITATASMIEFYIYNESYVIEKELIILFFFIPFCMLFLGFQWKLTIRVVKFIRARDEFYIIPSAPSGSFQMRPSLRLYLAAQKLKEIHNQKY